jgi:DeoR/GlpR family transcriptional regulator of sugar metabolism
MTVPEICERFSVSEATARRDLEMLAEQGRIQRVHGGAIAVDQAPPESPILDRQDEQADSKRRIGQAASRLVKDGDTVFLGSGTTVLSVARALRDHKNLTIITNSLPVMNTLSNTGHTLICLGGMLRHSEQSFIGHITEQALAEVRADKVVIGTRAISLEQGLTNDYMPETMTDRAILRAGREVIIVADHSKFGRVSTVMLAPIESVHTIVTDPETPQDFVVGVQERGIRVVIA